ncbi:hypothetical protein CO005_00255 [Candidatus Roizmanbacteria bacterium CG_4_8_14_3_um_filter_34_9]|uniref:Uncharacterized protein n=2 Tax=Candidatus Roizmaniibacteriota TaxID=1752723 RepID=A0A2M6YTV6_9BACT|nr:MAG: hypothetical protein COT02_03340 [Candidatus Roizmanbacteria bacterium CG07_land_8_20_14_0_80_34_15]PIW73654.1 MAG: hypothetical protein CO005_00255 [Candidatus Roizmanbacteria bacterium CG_4_8_14_3_um_filter_34_9]
MKLKNIIFAILLLTIPYSLITIHSFAVLMDSSQFKIESANVEIAGGNKSSTSYKLSDTVGQLAAGEYSSSGYVVKAGFQYLHSIIPFSFSISNTNIAFGTLVPNIPSTATTNLTISFGNSGQYQVTAIEEGPLKTQPGVAVPDTTCDGGGNTCSESLAKIWSSSSAYGFGYGMSGDDIPTDFTDSTYFRPFPDRTASEPPAVVMTSTNVSKNRVSTVTFKANISAFQQSGSYQTVINFVATPSY